MDVLASKNLEQRCPRNGKQLRVFVSKRSAYVTGDKRARD